MTTDPRAPPTTSSRRPHGDQKAPLVIGLQSRRRRRLLSTQSASTAKRRRQYRCQEDLRTLPPLPSSAACFVTNRPFRCQIQFQVLLPTALAQPPAGPQPAIAIAGARKPLGRPGWGFETEARIRIFPAAAQKTAAETGLAGSGPGRPAAGARQTPKHNYPAIIKKIS